MTGLGAPLVLEILQVAASNPNCLPSYTVSWSPDLSETYQLERSINGGIWTPIYTGTDLSFAQNSLAEAIYTYRVKVLGESDYSNTASVTVKTQNLITFEGCLNPNVAPYTYRVTTRTGCGTFTNVDTNNDPRCGYVEGICPGTTNTIINPPKMDLDGAGYRYSADLGFITATKLCIEVECVVTAKNQIPVWAYWLDTWGNNATNNVVGPISGMDVGDIVVYSANVSITNRKVFVYTYAKGITSAGDGAYKITKVSWG